MAKPLPKHWHASAPWVAESRDVLRPPVVVSQQAVVYTAKKDAFFFTFHMKQTEDNTRESSATQGRVIFDRVVAVD